MAESRTLLALHQADMWQDMLQVNRESGFSNLKLNFILSEGVNNSHIRDWCGNSLSLQHDSGQDSCDQVNKSVIVL